MSNKIKLIKSFMCHALDGIQAEFTITLSKEEYDALVLLLGELTRREEENKGLSEKQTELIYQVYKRLGRCYSVKRNTMNKTLAEKIEIAFKAAQRLIDDAEKKLAKAVAQENWLRAAELSGYIHGMMQTQAVYESVLPSAKASDDK